MSNVDNILLLPLIDECFEFLESSNSQHRRKGYALASKNYTRLAKNGIFGASLLQQEPRPRKAEELSTWLHQPSSVGDLQPRT